MQSLPVSPPPMTMTWRPPADGHRLRLAGDDAILAGQKIHGLVDAIELTARYGQVPRPGGTAAEHQCVEIGA
jgi:hypothetical protein